MRLAIGSRILSFLGLVLTLGLVLAEIGVAQEVRKCTATDYVCGAISPCRTHYKRFTPTEYDTWLGGNTFTMHEVIYVNASYVFIRWTENCAVEEGCWDYLGKCEKP